MSTPTTTEDFLALVERSGLLPAGVLLGYAARSQTGKESDLETAIGIARLMVDERMLTPFQARQFLNGRFRGFFLTGKHKILEPLGAGGMGRVLLCEHLVLQRMVAIKVLNVRANQPAGMAERFLREARVAASLDHPNIVRTLDADRGAMGPYLVMEYVDGSNLHQIVAHHGPMTVDRAAHYIWQAANGLQSAHKMGLIHRDIKPGNLLLDRSGTVKVLDLGLARFFDPERNDNLTAQFDDKNVIGTLDYISPEQALNSSTVDIRADIYSLGCTLYQMLSGRSPFEGMASTEKLLAHQLRSPKSIASIRADVPKDLEEVLKRMLRKRPEDRYQTPAEVAKALSRWSARLPPPPVEEMPENSAGSYRLGLCPTPASMANSQSGVTSSVGSSGVTTEITGVESRRKPIAVLAALRTPARTRPQAQTSQLSGSTGRFVEACKRLDRLRN